MICGNATGQYLPPMIVYKSKNLYYEWTRNGPENAIYGNSSSGWFDENLFETWFFDLFLDHVKDMPGKKVFLGDNLGLHFSQKVIDACLKNNIAFVCLIPNSFIYPKFDSKLIYYIPLDVGVFGPAKKM